MEPIATSENQITFIYNGETSVGKQAFGYIKSAKSKVHSINTAKDNFTIKQWAGLAEKLDLQAEDLISQQHPDFINKYGTNRDLQTIDWLKIIVKKPQLIKWSILIRGNSYFKISDPSDVIRYL